MEKLTVFELKRLCKAKGLKGYSKMLKAELLHLLMYRETLNTGVAVVNPQWGRAVAMNTMNFDPERHRIVKDYNAETDMYMIQGVSLKDMYNSKYDRSYKFKNQRFIQGAWVVPSDQWNNVCDYLNSLYTRPKQCKSLLDLAVFACRKYYYMHDLGKLGILPSKIAKLV